jgi:hypothetical protein
MKTKNKKAGFCRSFFTNLVGGIGLNCASLVRTGAHRPLGDRRISIRLVLVVEPTPVGSSPNTK